MKYAEIENRMDAMPSLFIKMKKLAKKEVCDRNDLLNMAMTALELSKHISSINTALTTHLQATLK